MRYFHKTKQQFHCPTVNVDRLWTLVSEQLRTHYANADAAKDAVPIIDVGRHVSTDARMRTHACRS
jgi:large subunit ribosomal protein L27Ae